MIRLYTLVGQSIVEEPDYLKWAEWMFGEGARGRTVAQHNVGKYWISTVFLGHDHNHRLPGGIKIFETAVFLGDRVEEIFRCATWAEAEAQHERIVKYYEKHASVKRLEVVDPVLDLPWQAD
jgi:hypothetical protein